MQRTVEQNALVLYGERGEELLRIEEEFTPGLAVISLHGAVPAELAPEFGDELLAAALSRPQLTLDLSDAPFLSAPALRAVLVARQALVSRAGSLRIRGVQIPVLQKMCDTGLDKLLLPEREP